MPKALNICMVTDTYYPFIGGIPEHIYNLSLNLRKQGHVVKILTTKFTGKRFKTKEAIPDEGFIHRIGRGVLVRVNKSYAQAPFGWRLFDKVEKFFAKEQFDVIHIHGTLAPMLPMIALRHSSAINVITYHSGHPKDIKHLIFHSLLIPYYKKLHGRIAVSEVARESSLHFFPADCKVIPNAIDVELFNPTASSLPEFRDNRPKILFLGRFEPRKGLKYLLQALPIIKKTISDVLLIIVGEGLLGYSYQEYISKNVKENVYFAGLIKNEERPKYYASCNVFCAPSIGRESFGIVLLEAMSCGKPIVASNIAGYQTIIENGKEGLLAERCNPEGFARQLIKVLSNRDLAKSMGEAGRTKALNYSWQKITSQVENYYYELLNRYPYYTRRYR